MDKFNHMLWATVSFVVLYMLFDNLINLSGPKLFVALLICILYSLIPDLDLKSSWIKGQFTQIVMYFILILAIFYFATGTLHLLFSIIILIGIEIFLQLIKHRGILHSPIFGVIIAIPLYFINYPNLSYFLAGAIGILSHYIVDKISSK